MKDLRNVGRVLFLAALCSGAALNAADNLKAFPPAPEGMSRHVLKLPPKENEADHRVQLIVGKSVETDGANRHFFAGRIEAKNIDGWGFTRYVVKDLGSLAGTRMAPRPDAPRKVQFVPLGGEPYLIRYNSKLPVVVYAPKDAEVRYRIWSAEKESHPIPAE